MMEQRSSMDSRRPHFKFTAISRPMVMAVALSLFAVSSSTAADSTTPGRAQRFYAAGDTKNALVALDEALSLNPHDATSHYMKANCFLRLQRPSEAFVEYGVAEKLVPGSKLAEYCRTARASISSVQKVGNSSRPGSSSSANGALRNPRVVSGDDDDDDNNNDDNKNIKPSIQGAEKITEVPEAKPGAKNSLPPGTLELIRKQAVLAREHALQTGQLEAEGELAKAENAAKSMREKAERSASHTRGSSEVVSVSQQEAEAMRAQAAASSDQIREWGKMKAAVKEWESQEKADEIKLQAENLQNRLLDTRTSRYTDVKLNPVGTNLYIRNYAKPPVVPLRVQAKIASLDSTVSAQNTSGKIQGGKRDASGKVVSTPMAAGVVQSAGTRSVVTVKGQVIPK